MSQKFKTVGEGGVHSHRIAPEKNRTEVDGKHKHLFFFNDRIIMTQFDGDHAHIITPEGYVSGEVVEHKHKIVVSTTTQDYEFVTDGSEYHSHEMLAESTTLSGVHRHQAEIMGAYYLSIVPQDLLAAMNLQVKQSKAFKSMSFQSECLETDFSLVKRLNETQLTPFLKAAVEMSIIKRMSSLGAGLRIESLILSRERFSDVGVATRFVLDQGLDLKSSNVLTDVFSFQVLSREGFEESTLQRIRITEGVEAIVGFLTDKEPVAEIAPDTLFASGSINEMTDNNFSQKTEKLEEEESSMETLTQKASKASSLFDLDIKKSDAELNKSADAPFRMGFEIISKNMDKRLVSGPVLIPETIDLQDDIVSADEIEKAGHNYMVKLAFRDDKDFLIYLGLSTESARGFMHTEFSRKIAVVESYMAPVDFELEGRKVLKGTWMMTMKVFDDEVWDLVKAKKITGFSIGGRGKSTPVEV